MISQRIPIFSFVTSLKTFVLLLVIGGKSFNNKQKNEISIYNIFEDKISLMNIYVSNQNLSECFTVIQEKNLIICDFNKLKAEVINLQPKHKDDIFFALNAKEYKIDEGFQKNQSIDLCFQKKGEIFFSFKEDPLWLYSFKISKSKFKILNKFKKPKFAYKNRPLLTNVCCDERNIYTLSEENDITMDYFNFFSYND